MKKIIRATILSLLLALKPAEKIHALGFDFIEKVYFSNNGSGKCSFTVDLSKISAIISLLQYIKQDYRKTTKIIGYDAFVAAKQLLRRMRGIHGVRIKYDDNMLKFTIIFHFQSIQVLNEVMKKIHNNMDSTTITYFRLTNNVFVREDMNSIARKLIQYKENDDSLVKSLDLDFFFRDITYTVAYSFDKNIKEFTNPLSVISRNKKTVRITHHVLNKDETRHSISNRIYF